MKETGENPSYVEMSYGLREITWGDYTSEEV